MLPHLPSSSGIWVTKGRYSLQHISQGKSKYGRIEDLPLSAVPAVVGSRQDQVTLLLSRESCLCVNSPMPTTKYLMTNHVLRGRIERYEVALTVFQVHVG